MTSGRSKSAYISLFQSDKGISNAADISIANKSTSQIINPAVKSRRNHRSLQETHIDQEDLKRLRPKDDLPLKVNSRNAGSNLSGSISGNLFPPSEGDKYHMVYFSLILSGVGFLLPYNSFLNAADLFKDKFCFKDTLFHFSLTYLMIMLLAVGLNNILVARVSFRMRISVGFLLAFLPLTSFTVFDICLGLFSSTTSYSLTMVSGALVALGCTVQQSSYYGYASMLPRQYTQAVMTGESLSGVIICSLRLLSELAFPRRPSVFFAVSCLLLALCFLTFHLALRTQFVTFYLNRASNQELSNPGVNGSYLNCSIKQNAGSASSLFGSRHSLKSNSIEQERALNSAKSNEGFLSETDQNHEEPPEIFDEEEVDELDLEEDYNYEVPGELPDLLEASNVRSIGEHSKFSQSVRCGYEMRVMVIRTIRKYMLTMVLIYTVTMSLYPGLLSIIPSRKWPKLMPIILLLTFNISDFSGKLLSGFSIRLSGKTLLCVSLSRLTLWPLILLCATPLSYPVLGFDTWSIMATILLGLSNGYLGSHTMIQAPQTLPTNQREMAGNLMTVSYAIGVTAGSIFAYCLKGIVDLASESGPIIHQYNATILPELSGNRSSQVVYNSVNINCE